MDRAQEYLLRQRNSLLWNMFPASVLTVFQWRVNCTLPNSLTSLVVGPLRDASLKDGSHVDLSIPRRHASQTSCLLKTRTRPSRALSRLKMVKVGRGYINIYGVPLLTCHHQKPPHSSFHRSTRTIKMVKVISLIALGSLAAVDAISFPSSMADVSALSSSLKNAITSMPNILVRKDGGGSCPAIWTNISASLTPYFLGSDGQCTDMARAAIRFAFHDAGE